MEVKLASVLCREIPTEIHLERCGADQLKKLARFWVGKDAAKLRKAECLAALIEVFREPETVREAVRKLPSAERTILGIYSRFGPTVSGALLAVELEARGLSEPDEADSRYSRYSSRAKRKGLESPG